MREDLLNNKHTVSKGLIKTSDATETEQLDAKNRWIRFFEKKRFVTILLRIFLQEFCSYFSTAFTFISSIVM